MEAKPAVNKARQLKIPAKEGVSNERLMAEYGMTPSVGNATTALEYTQDAFPDLSLTECYDVMTADNAAVTAGDLSKLEGMLAGQATALNAMFNNFAARAKRAQYVDQMEVYMRIAMKAQSQCRATVEAIAEIKFPKSPTYIRQANIAQQQQVNNGAPPAAKETSGAGGTILNPSNELISEVSSAKVDAGGAGAAIGFNPNVEALGQSDWTQERSRQGVLR